MIVDFLLERSSQTLTPGGTAVADGEAGGLARGWARAPRAKPSACGARETELDRLEIRHGSQPTDTAWRIVIVSPSRSGTSIDPSHRVFLRL